MAPFKLFWFDDRGQDLVEYTLLLAFICLASAALLINGHDSIAGIWSTTNQTLTNANAAAGGS